MSIISDSETDPRPAETVDSVAAPHGWVAYNSGPCEWFWAEDRASLEHELSDDIRPATHLEKYLLSKQGNRTHEHDGPEYVEKAVAWDVMVKSGEHIRARALEEAAQLIEANMLCGPDNLESIHPRSNPGNKVGLAYAVAIRALA